jgi:hypothetical protein
MWPRENYLWAQNEEKSWDRSNLMKWLRYNTYVEWNVWGLNGEIKCLSYWYSEEEPELPLLMERFHTIFSQETVVSLKRSRARLLSVYAKSISSLHHPLADVGRTSATTRSVESPERVADSQARFNALVNQINESAGNFSPVEIRRLQNWMASRMYRRILRTLPLSRPAKT